MANVTEGDTAVMICVLMTLDPMDRLGNEVIVTLSTVNGSGL